MCFCGALWERDKHLINIMPYVYESTASGVSDKTYNIWQKYNTDINVSLRVYKKAIKTARERLVSYKD